MRLRSAVCRAVLVTSIVWMLLGSLVLLYLLEPGSSSVSSDANRIVRPERYDAKQSFDKPDDAPKALKLQDDDIDPAVKKELIMLMSVGAFGEPNHGENGAAVSVDNNNNRFNENQFNVVASEMISVNRSLPDYRSSQCQQLSETYETENYPKTSIIIVFHNEAWTTLLRTLHSIVNRSPLHLLEEIIMVDDLSDRDYLRAPLEAYCKRFPVPVKIVHLPERSGLIRARLTGSGLAKGKILLFLDAHVEVTQGWLEPLVDRVASDRKRVVAPLIDVISDDTFEYVTASDTTWGGFNWHLNFRWYQVPKRELARRNGDRASPIQTPTIAGGLFAIDKQFFYDIGSYDEGMEVWGGENLEISFRVWMCGGSLEIHPCSRVGHVFRKKTPYTFPGGTAKVIHHNAARTAEVWMDDYKQFFYKMVPGAKTVDMGDITKRVELRKNLQCKSFKWYLETIYPEAPVPSEFRSLGYIQMDATELCVDTMGKKEGGNPGITTCHGAGGNQAWALTGKGEIRSDDLCLSSGLPFAMDDSLKLERCTGATPNNKHIFHIVGQQIVHNKTQKCLTGDGSKLALQNCSTDRKQRWMIEGYRPF
ncbi:unnamed protein product [Auanema sp. JU1783]|nr:unnamed protein product [Auanema sp. JU1783]